ncbi:hypothetical protein ABT297_22615 [Dactylosporangium sp. NPDC000555]|uniref:hypothetical protein n=1 Tax=Dactylosporangium sp. NPDC000555 TaxID=3154260 RepID=UPI00331D6019
MSILNALGFPIRRRARTEAPAEDAAPNIDEWIRQEAARDDAAHVVNGYRHGDWCSAGYMTCSHGGCTKKAWPSTVHTDHDCCGRSAHHRRQVEVR